uniref:Latrophilin Cirl n=1 Tax=Aceria tosichella TaxID=561515 RepID=A0A6G1SD19_9ACAR
MKATTSQMSHARPFRWRRKHQGESIRGTQEPEHSNHQQHQYLTLRSSAIGQHHEHHHHRHNHNLLSHELNNMGNANVCGSPRPIEATHTLPTTTTTITHSQRYSLPLQSPPPSSSTTATPLRITSHRRRRGGRLSSSLVTQAFSLPMLMSLSIIACVILSLLNLTIDQMQPKMVVAIGANGATSASSSSSSATAAAAGATPSLSQSTATLQRQQQQQQQSNSVIQYPSATAPTTITKAKYKTMYACEDRQLTMDCETGSKINLIRANFGRFSITQCNEQGQLDLSTDCMSPITFRIMQERCQDRQRCSVNATSVLFGDRCPKTRKYLEVHFQCQIIEPDTVDLRTPSPLPKPTPNPPMPTPGPGVPKPPNNPTLPAWRQPATNPADETPNQLFTPVINSQVMTPAMALSISTTNDNKLPDFYPGHSEQVIVSLAHLQVDNMARPRCYQWDPTSRQWTDRGARIVETNQTHTICAFDQQTSYVLVMDYSGPMPSISPSKQPAIQLPPIHEPQPLDYPQPDPAPDRGMYSTTNPPDGSDDVGKMIHPPTSDQSKQPQPASFSARLFLYLVGIVFVAVALMTLTFVASSMRSSAGAALKSLGNFAPFSGPKYKQRRHNGDPPSLHSNKDLLVINNSNGHSFIYAPASTTKISSSSSTHILSTGQPVGLNGQQQHQAGTLHRLQQQQMYSGNGATLSSLSGAGAQSNNYYYGLMGLNPLLQQQQQQQQKRQLSNESGSLVSEIIGDRLNRLNSSTRKRQQLLAMHQQAALVDSGAASNRPASGELGQRHSGTGDTRASFRSGSFSATTGATGNRANDGGAPPRSYATGGREAGQRSSTIAGGIQDERTMLLLNRHHQQNQLRQTSGSLTSNSASSLLGQHQTLMASNNNIRQRLEQREHIYFKRDGQRFGHEFTLKLAVDRNYRCLLKVRPLIPLQSITIHGHHVSFVDCSQGSAASSVVGGIDLGGNNNNSSSLGDSPLSIHSAGFSSEPTTSPLAAAAASINTSGSSGYSSMCSSSCPMAAKCTTTTTRHQSIGGPLIGAGQHQHQQQASMSSNYNNHQHHNINNNNNPICSHHHNNNKQNSVLSTTTDNRNNHHQRAHNSASLSSLSQPTAAGCGQLGGQQRQLIKQQQHHQMLRHFSGASHGSGSHLGSQLVYMFDWSASRFEVTKNKARTTVQTVLKFKNGEMLSLPLQIKFYQPECRQHLSWGSQLHFIDYECQINSMGQISVDRVQYY